MTAESTFTVKPSKLHSAEINVPGDKSISQRAVMFASLAAGKSRLSGILKGEDALSTLRACSALGASSVFEGDDLIVTGATNGWQAPSTDLDLGNSGTGMRLMSGLLAGQSFRSRLVGDASLSRRPMTRIVTPLSQMGADIRCLGADAKCPPVDIAGSRLSSIDYVLPMASAQVKSCVLLAGLYAEGTTSVTEPAPCRDHTESMLRFLGLPISVSANRITIDGFGADGPDIEAFDWRIPGDFSSAAFWLAAAACSPGTELTVNNLGLNSRRSGFLKVLTDMGADISVTIDSSAPKSEPFGSVIVKGTTLTGTSIGGDIIPNIIDELPVAAVCAALAEGETIICDAEELRVKESDRIALMVRHLQAAGVDVQERPDGMRIVGHGGKVAGGCTISPDHDHRIAMSMSILGLFADEPITIDGIQCVDTSYPGFFDQLRSLTDG